MQEEVTSKTIALAIKTAKLDGKVLQAALRQFMQLYRKKRDTPHRGKQTLKQLMRHGTGVSNIEITDANIKAFSQTAKKYGVDFALKKTDDRYLVFFKGRDADVLTAAFREFSAKKLDMERKPSVRRDIGEKKAEAAKRTAARDITKHPNYKYLSDADKKNAFDVERYIRAQRKKKRTPAVVAPEEPFDLYDIDLSDMNMAAEESGE